MTERGVKPSKSQVFKNLREDFKWAKQAKTEIDKSMVKWNDLYYAKKLGNEVQNRSQVVLKEIAKQIEWAKPNITEPFTSTSKPVRIKSGVSENRSNVLEKYLNQEFVGNFDRETFMDNLTDVMFREGTVWVHTSWSREEDVRKETFENLTLEQLVSDEREPEEISENEDGTYNGFYLETRVLANCPTAEVCRNESIFPDPSAKSDKDMSFLCFERTTTFGELRKEGVKEEDIDQLWAKSQNASDSALEIQRNVDNREYGGRQDFRRADEASTKVIVIEYWGQYDLDGDGILQPIKAVFSKEGYVNISLEENPMPSKRIPFFRETYSSITGALWGNALAYFLGDNQRIRSGLMRGILDNMSNANNGQKFITRGALDYVNMKRMKNGEKYIVVNKPDSVVDGSYNNIPTSVMETMNMVTQETKELSGVQAGGPALNKSALGDDGADEQLTMSQQRMVGLVRKVSSLLGKVMKEWLEMAEVFLDDDQIVALQDSSSVDINVFKDMYKASCKMLVGTDIVKAKRLREINLLLQQSKAMEGRTPPETMSQLIAEMYELMDMPDKAKAMMDYKPQPSPEQIAMQQLEMQEKQLELQERMTKMEVEKVDAETRRIIAQTGMFNAQAGAEYKKAQSAEKYSKAQSHQVDTALKPAQVEKELTKSKGE